MVLLHTCPALAEQNGWRVGGTVLLHALMQQAATERIPEACDEHSPNPYGAPDIVAENSGAVIVHSD